jgi:hypothetical protein
MVEIVANTGSIPGSFRINLAEGFRAARQFAIDDVWVMSFLKLQI